MVGFVPLWLSGCFSMKKIASGIHILVFSMGDSVKLFKVIVGCRIDVTFRFCASLMVEWLS